MDNTDYPFVSVIIPVRNGAGRIENCLDSISVQNYPKERMEVIVADGLSTDNTKEIARSKGAIVIDNPRVIQGAGKNEAMKIAKGELIAFSEDDCVVPEDWVSTGVELLQKNRQAVGLGGPTPLPETSGTFARACEIIFNLAGKSGHTVQSAVDMGDEVEDVAGGNVIYRRDLFEVFLPFREDRTEDVEMSIKIKRGGGRLLFATNFYAWHFKKENPIGFYKQMHRFSLGRKRLSREYSEALKPLHVMAALVAPLCLLFLTATCLIGGLMAGFLLLLFCFAVAFFYTIFQRSNIAVAFLFPFALAIFFTGWSAGFSKETLYPGKFKIPGASAI